MFPRHLIAALLTASVCVPIQACSVGMALSGSENPDLGAIKVGASRGEVELHLGPRPRPLPCPTPGVLTCTSMRSATNRVPGAPSDMA
jgi:hypothetical protein